MPRVLGIIERRSQNANKITISIEDTSAAQPARYRTCNFESGARSDGTATFEVDLRDLADRA
jgi:hypothetical protein